MKKLLLFVFAFVLGSFATLYIRESFAQELKLPQPEEVVLQTMQQINAPIIYTPPQTAANSFASLLAPLEKPQVLGAADTQPRSTKYPKMSIAIVGDSMVDTMDTNLPYLQRELSLVYPTTTFTLLNYGIGSTTIDSGPSRLVEPFAYKDRSYEPIITLKPDLVIIESFAYNPLPDGNLAHHAEVVTQMVDSLRSHGISRIALMATIAPNREQFGRGPGGVNWNIETQDIHTAAINTYLQNTFTIAKNLNLPLIDAYSQSRDLLGNGLLDYINTHDHIHPSVAGHQFIAKQIINTLVTTKILE